MKILKLALLTILFIPTFGNAFMGINTNEVLNYNAVAPFVDLFKSAEPFKGAGVTYDQHGWPLRLNGSQTSTYFLKWFNADALPQGNYVVNYKGEGQISYNADGVQIVSRAPGRDVIRFIPNQKFNEITARLFITKMNVRNPIKDIKITYSGGICQNNPYRTVPAGAKCPGSRYLAFEHHANKGIVFNPDYLKFMKGFKTLRFMNMSGIVRNPISNWNNRPKLTDATWGGTEGQRGAPLEIMIKLSNMLNADAWFNIPFAADDNYINQHAYLVKKLLRPHLKAYVEYTNEAWNGIFRNQMKYLQDRGIILKLDTDRNKAAQKYYSKRSKQIFIAWERVLPKQRLVRVLGGFTPAGSMTKTLLDYDNVNHHTDAFAIAPYFYSSEADLLKIKNKNDIFRLINHPTQVKSLPSVIKQVRNQNNLLKQNYPHVKLVAYEGGQHFVYYKSKSKKDFPNPQIFAANKDQRMLTAYTKLIDDFRRNGVLFMAFRAPESNAKFGAWGVKEHLREPDHLAPKYQSLKRYFGVPKPIFR